MGKKRHNPERRAWRGRSHRKGGRLVRALIAAALLAGCEPPAHVEAYGTIAPGDGGAPVVWEEPAPWPTCPDDDTPRVERRSETCFCDPDGVCVAADGVTSCQTVRAPCVVR